MIILASSSKYRQELLRRLNIDFKAIAADINEDEFKSSSLSHISIAETLSLEKAKKVQKNFQDSIIIGSDQVLSFNDEIFDKPMSEKKAIEQLSRLQGKSHQLITSFSVIKKEKVITETVIANMHMKKLESDQIINYVNKDMPLYCCGSYKLESLGIALFDKIECEDDTSIIGLPLLKLIKALENFDLKIL